MRRRWSFALLLTLFVPAAARAQERGPDPTRRTTVARVFDAKEAGLAAAAVTFAGCVPHVGVGAGPVDVQTVVADERGFARASLVPGLCYVAWAIGPADAAGTGVRSDPFGAFGAGALVELHCDQAYVPRRIAITGVEAWQPNGGLRFVVTTPSPGVDEELPLRDGGLDVPPLPWVRLEVRTADGQPAWIAPADAEQIAVPPPQRLRVIVHDEAGAPLVGAVVRQRVGHRPPWRSDASSLGGCNEPRMRSLGVTGADGSAEVVVCYGGDPLRESRHGDLLVFAGAPGCAESAGGVFRGQFCVDDRVVPRAPEGALPFTCRRVAPLAGRVGRVPHGTVACLRAVGKLFGGGGGYTHDERVFVADVTPDGGFAFAGVPDDLHCCRITLVARDPGSSLPVFATVAGRDLPAELLVRPDGRTLPWEANDVGFALRDPGGGPARGSVLCLVPQLMDGVLARDAVVRVPLDARGEVTVSLVGSSWFAYAMTAQGGVLQPFDATARSSKIELTLQPFATMRVRLLDDLGAPIAGARLESRGAATRAAGSPAQIVAQSVIAAAGRPGWSSLRTDANGRVAIPYFPVEGLTPKARFRWDSGTSVDFSVVTGDQETEVRVRAAK